MGEAAEKEPLYQVGDYLISKRRLQNPAPYITEDGRPNVGALQVFREAEWFDYQMHGIEGWHYPVKFVLLPDHLSHKIPDESPGYICGILNFQGEK